jgi:hypothetical protein
MTMEITKIMRNQWDRVAAAVLVVVGLLALAVGWAGASRTSFPAEQIPYILSGGLFALCAIAIGTTLWLSADLRDEWCKLDHLDETLAEHTAVLAALSSPNGDAVHPAPRVIALAERELGPASVVEHGGQPRPTAQSSRR